MLSLSDNNITAIIVSIPGITAAIISFMTYMQNIFNHRENAEKLDKAAIKTAETAAKLDLVETNINGKMSALLEATKSASFAEGEKSEKDKGKGEIK